MTGSLIWRWPSLQNDEGSSVRNDRNYLFEMIYDYHFGRGAVSIPAEGGIETAPRQQPKEPSRKASWICGKKKTSKTTLKIPLTPQAFLCLAAVSSIWQRIIYSIWLFSRWLSFRNWVLKRPSLRYDKSFEMMLVLKSWKSSEQLSIRNDAGLSLRYDRAIFLHACGAFRLSAVWYDGTEPLASNLYQTPNSRLKRVLRWRIICSIWWEGFSFRYDGAKFSSWNCV